ncbi:dTDP-4-dehydrorhamnose 3,5-epimerase [Gammaproteobacteria bacterium]|nr:dTDP-4-dehydrorhamnose 3,5-epimerase [Gammaproteobacteria bacterium]
MDNLKLKEIYINDLNKIGLKSFKKIALSDERGELQILHESKDNFELDGFSIKESFSHKGAARGLHIQDPNVSPQTKIIEVLEGTIYDFVYDTRSLKCIYYFKLDAIQDISILVPSHFAHGFIALTDIRFRYVCFGGYDEYNETTYNFLNSAAKALNINKLDLSDKDCAYPELKCEL